MNNLRLIFFLILSQNIYATNYTTNYTTNDTLNVFAINGLSIRNQPDLKSQKLGKIDFGKSVIVMEIFNFSKKDTIESRPGNWVKISFEKLEGFVFDGYLSSLPVPQLKVDERETYSHFYNYVEKFYPRSKNEIRVIEPYFDLDGKDARGFLVSVFPKRIKRIDVSGYEEWEVQLNFEKYRFAELISLVEVFHASPHAKESFKKALKKFSPSKKLVEKSIHNSQIIVGDFKIIDGISSKVISYSGGG